MSCQNQRLRLERSLHLLMCRENLSPKPRATGSFPVTLSLFRKFGRISRRDYCLEALVLLSDSQNRALDLLQRSFA